MKKIRKLPNESNLLICGLARNAEKQVSKTIKNLLDASGSFATTRMLIIESDSEDSTATQIAKLTKVDTRIKLLSLGELRTAYPLRTQRIAFCRNRYLNEVNTNPEYNDVDYVMIADLDEVNNLISTEAILSCWGTGTDWDVLTANQLDFYYDIWALRHPYWCPYDCWQAKKWLETLYSPIEAVNIAVTQKQIHIPKESPLIEVNSAFGGLAIYRRSALKGCSYIGLDEMNEEICEHVTLHKQLKTNGCRIFINPRLINAKNVEHIQPKSTGTMIIHILKWHFFAFLKNRIKI